MEALYWGAPGVEAGKLVQKQRGLNIGELLKTF